MRMDNYVVGNVVIVLVVVIIVVVFGIEGVIRWMVIGV